MEDQEDQLLNQAIIDFNKRQYREAIKKFEVLLKTKAFSAQQGLILNCLGIAYCHIHDYEQAVAYSLQALNAGLEELDVYQNLSNAYYHMKNAPCALEYALIAKEISPHNPYVCFSLGNALCLDTQFDEAVDIYEEGIELNSKIADIHYALAKVLTEIGRYDYAVNEYLEAIHYGLDNGEVNYHLAKSFELNGFAEKAIKYYMISMDDDYPLAYRSLGLLLCQEKKEQEALECFEKYLEYDLEEDDRAMVCQFIQQFKPQQLL